jgi:flagellar hook-basal body complex protein FliE
MPTPSAAALAYSNLSRLTDASSLAKAGGDAAGGGFASMLKDALSAVKESGQKADSEAHAMVAGKTNIVDVVTAVAESEVAISAIVSVRDKVIQAYEDIMKMPI